MKPTEIIGKILNYINPLNQFISLSNYYIGITNDGEQRLFTQHNVNKNSGTWIYIGAETNEEARIIEKHFLSLGMKGGPGGGDNSSKVVYCYLITNTTKE